MTQCSAKSRSTGERCRALAMKERNVCRIHGGKTPRGNKPALKHSIYEKFLSADEKATWSDIEIGKVDEELKLARLQLTRALAAQQKAKDEPEVDSVVVTKTGAGATTVQKTLKKTDYNYIIDRALGRISSLERSRAELLAGVPQTPAATSFVIENYDEDEV